MRNTILADLHVLVLEDEFLIAMDVEQLCRDLGAREVSIVRRLADLPRGEEVRFPFDFAVVDVSVGGVPTLELAAELRQTGTPFVFATGYAETDDLFASFPQVPVLSKPYAAEAFACAVQIALGGQAQAALEPSTCDAIASGP